jgi:hypothetical protein
MGQVLPSGVPLRAANAGMGPLVNDAGMFLTAIIDREDAALMEPIRSVMCLRDCRSAGSGWGGYRGWDGSAMDLRDDDAQGETHVDTPPPRG